MKIWTALSTEPEDARWAALAERLSAAGVANEYHPWPGGQNSAPSPAELEPFYHVRVAPALGPTVLKSLNAQSSLIHLLGLTDGILRAADGGWWPRCALVEALGQILISRGPELDVRGNVMISGTGGLALAAVAAFFRAGFKKFMVTTGRPEEGEALIKTLRAHFFGLEIEWIAMDRIVLLAGECSVLVNGARPEREPELLTELSYLNFLRRPGFVFDLAATGSDSALLTEAREANVEAVHGRLVEARTDALWATWAFGVQLPPTPEG